MNKIHLQYFKGGLPYCINSNRLELARKLIANNQVSTDHDKITCKICKNRANSLDSLKTLKV